MKTHQGETMNSIQSVRIELNVLEMLAAMALAF
jgi:hypothetical protein